MIGLVFGKEKVDEPGTDIQEISGPKGQRSQEKGKELFYSTMH